MVNDNIIYVKKYDAQDMEKFPVHEREIWRYSGYMGLDKNPDEELKKYLVDIYKELEGKFQFKVCYRRMPLQWENDMPQLPFTCHSKDLAKCLAGCDEMILFAATIGLEIDRKIARYERISPTKALLSHAYGAERIESLCDGFCREIEQELSEEQLYCSNRFSPGYGDLPLETQVEFFRLMDCNRQIGISLNDSLLMTPSKSVTAIFGIGKCGWNRQEHKCSECSNTECEFRR